MCLITAGEKSSPVVLQKLNKIIIICQISIHFFLSDPKDDEVFSGDLMCMVLPPLFNFFCSIAEVFISSSPFLFSGDAPDTNIITFNGDVF